MAHKRSYLHNSRTLDFQPDSVKRWGESWDNIIEEKWLHLHDKTLKAAQEVLQKEYPNIIDKLKHEYLVPEVVKSLKPEMQDHMNSLTKTHVESLFRDYMSEQQKSIGQNISRFQNHMNEQERLVDDHTSRLKNYMDEQERSVNKEIRLLEGTLANGLKSAFISAANSLNESSEEILNTMVSYDLV